MLKVDKPTWDALVGARTSAMATDPENWGISLKHGREKPIKNERFLALSVLTMQFSGWISPLPAVRCAGHTAPYSALYP